MLTQMNVLSDVSLNGWEIGGIVVALVVLGIAVWMAPEFIRYMKIRSL